MSTADAVLYPRRRERGGTATGASRLALALAPALAVVPLTAGIGLWIASLAAIDPAAVDDYGLLGELPLMWFAALAVLVVGGAAVIAGGRCGGWLMALYVAAVVAVLYATIPAVADAPQYPWVYKHIGVTQLILASGAIDPALDIYNRWPGFFALAAAFGGLAGLPDPVTWAAWAEPTFMAIDALLVGAIAHALTHHVRVAGGAALLFVLFNWVGQTYFSPQAAASTIALALLLVVLRGLGPARVSRRRRSGEPPVRSLPWSRGAVIGVVLVLDAALVVTHQLTPFVLVAQVAALIVVGAIRSWPVLAAMLVLPAILLAANLAYLLDHFTLLTGIDPLDNLRSAGTYDVARSAGKTLNAQLSLLLSAGMFAAATLAALRLWRRGFGRLALTLLALMIAPFSVVLLQSYGGEASLRLILNAAPWAAILVMAAVATIRSRGRRVALSVGIAGAACALCVPAFYGVSQLNIIPASTVAVSEDFYARAPEGSVLMLAGPGFPLRVGARYATFAGPVGDADPNLLLDDRFRSRPLGGRDLSAVIEEIRRYAPHGFVAFSTTEQRWSDTFGLTPAGALGELEGRMARSRRFRLWSGSKTARIYELVPIVRQQA